LNNQLGDLLGAPISLFDHGLQTASRALRANASDEVVVGSLLHDIFETTVTKTHGEMAAAFLEPWISPKMHWILAHHEIFQGYYYFGKLGMNKDLRAMFSDSPFFEVTVEWCEKFDMPSFDPNYPMLPLAVFDGPLKRVFDLPQFWWNPNHPKAGAIGGLVNGTEEATQECTNTWTCHEVEEGPAVAVTI